MARGQPKVIRCKCKSETAETNLFLTGKTKTVTQYGNQTNVTLYEVQHVDCGREFFTNHTDAVKLPTLQASLPLKSAVG